MPRIVDISVQVTVDGLVVVPEVAHVSGPALLQFSLIWDPVQMPGKYRFPVDFAVQVIDPGSCFPYSSWTLSDSVATLVNANDFKGLYWYFVKVDEIDVVTNEATGKVFSLSVDPMINNQ